MRRQIFLPISPYLRRQLGKLSAQPGGPGVPVGQKKIAARHPKHTGYRAVRQKLPDPIGAYRRVGRAHVMMIIEEHQCCARMLFSVGFNERVREGMAVMQMDFRPGAGTQQGADDEADQGGAGHTHM